MDERADIVLSHSSATADNNASVVDEWTLMQHLGENALSVMTEHWSTWVTEADIESAHQAGINHLRIPVGYWAFLDNTENEPYLFKSGQLQFLEDCLGWAYKRGMYAIIDLVRSSSEAGCSFPGVCPDAEACFYHTARSTRLAEW